jgi:hypothetical protein
MVRNVQRSRDTPTLHGNVFSKHPIGMETNTSPAPGSGAGRTSRAETANLKKLTCLLALFVRKSVEVAENECRQLCQF